MRTPSPSSPLPGLPVPNLYPPPGPRPMKFAATMVRVATGPEIRTPWEPLAEIRFPAAGIAARRSDCSTRNQDTLGAIACLEVETACGRTITPIWLPSTTLPVAVGLNLHSLRAVAGDHVVLLRIGPTDGRVVRVQNDALQRVPEPSKGHVSGPEAAEPVFGSTG